MSGFEMIYRQKGTNYKIIINLTIPKLKFFLKDYIVFLVTLCYHT